MVKVKYSYIPNEYTLYINPQNPYKMDSTERQTLIAWLNVSMSNGEHQSECIDVKW